VGKVVAQLREALEPEQVVLGGGNAKKLKKLPPGTMRGNNQNAFKGGFRLWSEDKREAFMVPPNHDRSQCRACTGLSVHCRFSSRATTRLSTRR